MKWKKIILYVGIIFLIIIVILSIDFISIPIGQCTIGREAIHTKFCPVCHENPEITFNEAKEWEWVCCADPLHISCRHENLESLEITTEEEFNSLLEMCGCKT